MEDTKNDTLKLLGKARSGGPDALDALLRHAIDRLTLLTRRMLGQFPRVRPWVETDDVLQNALLRLVNALREVKPESPRHFFALAALQIRRELIDLARTLNGPCNAPYRNMGVFEEQNEPVDEKSGVLSLLAWGELHEEIARLPEEEQEVVNLVLYQGLTQAETSDVLDVSLRTVQRRWHSALLKLHHFWNRE